MSLNHTIRLINDNYTSALSDLILRHYEAKIIIAKLNKIYFDNNITTEKLKELGCLFSGVMNNMSSVYCVAPSNLIGDVSAGFKAAGLCIRNVLTIPIITKTTCTCIRNRQEYDESNLMYVVYATKPCFTSHLNYTDIVKERNCSYPANWTWFKGTQIQAYEQIMKISSEHRDEILDPFMNLGDIGEAAINADRHYTGIEPDGYLFRTAKDRLDHVGE